MVTRVRRLLVFLRLFAVCVGILSSCGINLLQRYTKFVNNDSLVVDFDDHNTTTGIPYDLDYIRNQEQEAFLLSTEPDPNLKTMARTEFVFFFGFRNMAMQFFYTVLYAIDNDFQQLYLPSLRYEDYSGASGTTLIPHIPHELLFDVVYWNSFYPKLPRLVRYHPVFTDLSNTTGRWVDDGKAANATKPYPSPDAAFSRYRQLRQEWYKTGQPHPSDALNFRAFQPCPDMRRLLAKVAPPPDSDHNSQGLLSDKNRKPTLSLHARVEPDMLIHFDCPRPYEANLTSILTSLYTFFPHSDDEGNTPPFSRVHVPINRRMMEDAHNGGWTKWKQDGIDTRTINDGNLAILNQIRDKGLWNERVPVYEYGIGALNGTRFMQYPDISGAMVDFFIAVDAGVFVGSPVSTWSFDVVQARVYAGNYENYMYFPDGIRRVTEVNATMAPGSFTYC